LHLKALNRKGREETAANFEEKTVFEWGELYFYKILVITITISFRYTGERT